MKRLLSFGFAILFLMAPGCRQSTVPGSYSVEAKLTGAAADDVQSDVVTLTPGEKNNVDITVAYKRMPGTAAKLKYKVQVESRGELKVTPVAKGGWLIDDDLSSETAGHSSTQRFVIEVPPAPTEGEQEIGVTVVPESSEQWRSAVKFKIGR